MQGNHPSADDSEEPVGRVGVVIRTGTVGELSIQHQCDGVDDTLQGWPSSPPKPPRPFEKAAWGAVTSQRFLGPKSSSSKNPGPVPGIRTLRGQQREL